MEKHELTCPNCNYSLRGLPHNTCPECGNTFDREELGNDPELQRLGSPVYAKQGKGFVRKTIETLILFTFKPWVFAQRLRVDEPLRPAIAVFVISVIIDSLLLFKPWSYVIYTFVIYTPLFAATMMIFVLVFALLFSAGSVRTTNSWSFCNRFRFWCMVNAYSTILTLLWKPFCAGTWDLEWPDYTTVWPVVYLHVKTEAYYVTGLLLWWTTIMAIILLYRNRPRWLAIMYIPIAFFFARIAIQIVDSFILRLARS